MERDVGNRENNGVSRAAEAAAAAPPPTPPHPFSREVNQVEKRQRKLPVIFVQFKSTLRQLGSSGLIKKMNRGHGFVHFYYLVAPIQQHQLLFQNYQLFLLCKQPAALRLLAQ